MGTDSLKVRPLKPLLQDPSVRPLTNDIAAELATDFDNSIRLEEIVTFSDRDATFLTQLGPNPSNGEGLVQQFDFSHEPSIVAFLDALVAADANGQGLDPHGHKLLDVSQSVISRLGNRRIKNGVSEAEGAARSHPVLASDGVAAIARVVMDLVGDGPLNAVGFGRPLSHTARFRVAQAGLRAHYDDSKYTLSIQVNDDLYHDDAVGGEFVLPDHGIMIRPRKYTGILIGGKVKHMVRHFGDARIGGGGRISPEEELPSDIPPADENRVPLSKKEPDHMVELSDAL